MTTERDATARRRSRASFVVRVWDEPSTPDGGDALDGGAAIRGSVQPVAGGTIRYFATLDGLSGAIASSLGLPAWAPGRDALGREDRGR